MMTTKLATIQQYLDALRAFDPGVTRCREGVALTLDTHLDARLVSARDPDDDEYDPSGDVEQDIREEIAAALGDLDADIIVDEDGVTVVPGALDITRLRGDHALILAEYEQIYCACGVSLNEGPGEIRASNFDTTSALPHFNHRAAHAGDLAHECTWTRAGGRM